MSSGDCEQRRLGRAHGHGVDCALPGKAVKETTLAASGARPHCHQLEAPPQRASCRGETEPIGWCALERAHRCARLENRALRPRPGGLRVCQLPQAPVLPACAAPRRPSKAPRRRSAQPAARLRQQTRPAAGCVAPCGRSAEGTRSQRTASHGRTTRPHGQTDAPSSRSWPLTKAAVPHKRRARARATQQRQSCAAPRVGAPCNCPS